MQLIIDGDLGNIVDMTKLPRLKSDAGYYELMVFQSRGIVKKNFSEPQTPPSKNKLHLY